MTILLTILTPGSVPGRAGNRSLGFPVPGEDSSSLCIPEPEPYLDPSGRFHRANYSGDSKVSWDYRWCEEGRRSSWGSLRRRKSLTFMIFNLTPNPDILIHGLQMSLLNKLFRTGSFEFRSLASKLVSERPRAKFLYFNPVICHFPLETVQPRTLNIRPHWFWALISQFKSRRRDKKNFALKIDLLIYFWSNNRILL